MALLLVISFYFQSCNNNQFMCGVRCQKWGNINFFAAGNPNISRNDINTISTQTDRHIPTHMGLINLLCNRTLSSGSNITVNGDAYLQAALPLKEVPFHSRLIPQPLNGWHIFHRYINCSKLQLTLSTFKYKHRYSFHFISFLPSVSLIRPHNPQHTHTHTHLSFFTSVPVTPPISVQLK